MKFLITMLTCLVMASPAWATETYDIQIVKQPEQKWRFNRVVARSVDDITHVSGRLTASNTIGLPRGHIDVAAFSASGDLIAETTTAYRSSLLVRKIKRKGGVRFSAEIDSNLPPGSVIKLAFHRNDSLPEIKPVHAGNIAY